VLLCYQIHLVLLCYQIHERFESVMGKCDLEAIGPPSIFEVIHKADQSYHFLQHWPNVASNIKAEISHAQGLPSTL